MASVYFGCPACQGHSFTVTHASFYPPHEQQGLTEIKCLECAFIVKYVLFTCGCCNPDAFATCQVKTCTNPGTPTNTPCRL
jgi:hypothetical protein